MHNHRVPLIYARVSVYAYAHFLRRYARTHGDKLCAYYESSSAKGKPDGKTLELGSAQTPSSNGSAGFRYALRSSAKPLEAVRQDRVWAEPSSGNNSR